MKPLAGRGMRYIERSANLRSEYSLLTRSANGFVYRPTFQMSVLNRYELTCWRRQTPSMSIITLICGLSSNHLKA